MSDQYDQPMRGLPAARGLYDPRYEHDSCGVGFLANIHGRKTHAIIEKGIEVLENLLHRGATGADVNTGDGAGILFQVPDKFLRRECEGLGISLPAPGATGAWQATSAVPAIAPAVSIRKSLRDIPLFILFLLCDYV